MQLHRDRDDFDAAGAELALIGQRTPKHARRFIEKYDLDGLRLLVDPKRDVYDAAGMKVASVADLFGPRVVLKGLKTAASERVVQGMTQGSAKQLGGVLVIAPGGEITWSHVAVDASDNPPNSELLDAVRDAAASA